MTSRQKMVSPNIGTNRSETITSTESNITILGNNNEYKQLKHAPQKYNWLWLDAVKLLYTVFGILLLTIMILPSIFVYILAPKYSSTQLSEPLTQTNHCAGVSPSSSWTLDASTIITMQIDTSECNFKETPLYFVSMAGLADHFCLTGYNGIYTPTAQSFQIYVEPVCGGWNGTNFLNAAQTNAWNVNWVGFYQ